MNAWATAPATVICDVKMPRRQAAAGANSVALGLIRGSVQLVPYDSRWPALFTAEAALLGAALEGQIGRIAHIGSTAVPGMDSKPILDLMVEVPSLRTPTLLHRTLGRFGYALESDDDVPDRLFFIKQAGMNPTHHLSVCEANSNFWQSHLDFRERLRTERALAADYLALKRRLCSEFANDRRGYTRAKTAFIETALGM